MERIPEPAGGALGSDVAMAPMPGIWLSPAKATLLSVLAVLALTLAFVVGLMVGLFFRPAQRRLTAISVFCLLSGFSVSPSAFGGALRILSSRKWRGDPPPP